MHNVKQFRLVITQDTPYDTPMYLFDAEGGDVFKFEAGFTLQSFGGTSESASSEVSVRLVSDSDVSGSLILDDGDLDQMLCQYSVPDGWPRSAADIGGAGPFSDSFGFNSIDPQVPIPARGRKLYLKLVEPTQLPDVNAEYSIQLSVTVTKL